MINRLRRLYRFLRYGERTISIEVESKIVQCQDVETMDFYDCSKCLFSVCCYRENKPKFLRYLKRRDFFRDGAVKRMDIPEERPDLFGSEGIYEWER